MWIYTQSINYIHIKQEVRDFEQEVRNFEQEVRNI